MDIMHLAYPVHVDRLDSWWKGYFSSPSSPECSRVSSLKISGDGRSVNKMAKYILMIPWPIKSLSLSQDLDTRELSSPPYQLTELRASRLSPWTLCWILKESAIAGSLKTLHMPCYRFLNPWNISIPSLNGPYPANVLQELVDANKLMENLRAGVTRWYIQGDGPPRATENEIDKIPPKVTEIGFTMMDSVSLTNSLFLSSPDIP
jgi:hypothetical protein